MRSPEPGLTQDEERRQAPQLPRPFGRRAIDRIDLTARQTEVLDLVTEGLENKEIAAALGISEQGSKQQVSVLLRKFRVGSRAALVRTAVTMRLLGGRRSLSDLHYEYLFDRAPIGIALTRGPEHRYVQVNQAYVELFGDRDFVGRAFGEVFPSGSAPAAETLSQVYRDGIGVHFDLARTCVVRPDQPDRDAVLAYMLEATHGADGAADGLVLYVWEITDRAALRRRLERL